MTEYRSPPDPTSCLEQAPRSLDAIGRWSGKSRPGTSWLMADLINARSSSALRDVLAYRPSSEAPAHYRGQLYWGVRTTRGRAEGQRCCIELLQVEYDCRPESIGRGYQAGVFM
jgi:hypothetical protein